MICSAKDIEFEDLEFTWGIKGTLFKSYGNNFFSRECLVSTNKTCSAMVDENRNIKCMKVEERVNNLKRSVYDKANLVLIDGDFFKKCEAKLSFS